MRIVRIKSVVVAFCALLLGIGAGGISFGGGGQGELPPRIAPTGKKKVPPALPGDRFDNEGQIP